MKLNKKVLSHERAQKAIRYASHSLKVEGFNVTKEDEALVYKALVGNITEEQFHQEVKRIVNV
ncbi:hypothetical protein F9802_12875 [Bacillus aerolatus]|uniref:Antitoxin VbhA domain-containing protein n=1 Tax=Bacillus aerolatus TaxID=2653354 RepID=A0A6I1FI87_9BACI|nr:antitoxin VbhA family protein [Bacillus aerolatus]KAB7705953.1 hypothetical protein F9802_12875 [Bacillus aerolatus]